MPKVSTSYKPGQSGNPKGRPPKGWTLADTMREFLSSKDPKTKKQRRLQLIEKTAEQAAKGDPTALKLIWNYIDGMPAQPILGADGGNLKIEVELKNDSQNIKTIEMPALPEAYRE